LVPLLESVQRGRTTQQWQALLREVDVPHAPVWDYAELFADPQAAARGLRVTARDPQGRPVDLVGSPFHIAGTTLPSPTPPPGLGQHTDEVLRDLLGLDAERVAELRQQGVIG
jgi:formyl-CoA transferase